MLHINKHFIPPAPLPFERCQQNGHAYVRYEADPHGLSAHETGAKLDAGKPKLGLVLGGFAQALVEVGRVGTYGAEKYTPDGWMRVIDGQARYTDALFRHQLAEAAGEVCDPDTGLMHAAHAAWNALAKLELLLREKAAPSKKMGALAQALGQR